MAGFFDKEYAEGSTGLGDPHSELLGVGGLERTGNVLLGEKKTREISDKLGQLDIGRGLLESKKVTAPDLTDQEKRIIAQMKEIAMGDPELSQLYVQNIQKAFQGTDIPLGLQKDIEDMQLQSQEAIARRLGAVGDIRSTPGIKSAEKTRREVLGLREGARQEAIRRAEGLMTSQQARQIGAGQVALSPLTHSGSLQSRAAQQQALNEAQRQAGLMNLAGTIAGSYGGRRQSGLTQQSTASTESSPEVFDYYAQGTGSF